MTHGKARLSAPARMLLAMTALASIGWAAPAWSQDATLLPDGQTITPTAAGGAVFQSLDPHLQDHRKYRAAQAVKTALSPDGRTLLVMTSGYNLLNYTGGANGGQPEPADSTEYIFVYNVAGSHQGAPVQTQVLQVANTFMGLVWAPDGQHFYASGGINDAVLVFANGGAGWSQSATIPLNHTSYANNLTGPAALLGAFLYNGIGFEESATPASMAISPDGTRLAVANIYNDSVSLIDTTTNSVLWEYDLRPYNNTPALTGTAGGEAPFGVAIAPNPVEGFTIFVSSVRDREVDAMPLRDIPPDGGTLQRIALPGTPNNMVLSPNGKRLYVAQDNSDQVAVLNTANFKVVDEIAPLDVPGLTDVGRQYTGAAPNGLAISPDGSMLYVTMGGANALGMVNLAANGGPAPVALIPTGWYPHSVSVSKDGKTLYVVNGKSDPGPNPKYLHAASNEYVLQLEQAGFLTLPVPAAGDYAPLTAQVVANNGYATAESGHDKAVMAALHAKIQHVIYIIKENRTFDQILGDLTNGANGDPAIAEYGHRVTPNFHRLASSFVTLDNFYCAGEVSGDGWPWSTETRESDFGTTTIPVNYANRGASNDSEGLNRIVNVGLDTNGRVASFPTVNGIGNLYQVLGDAFPGGYTNLLPGNNNDFATDGPEGTPPQQGYLWDSALRAGLTVRDYGMLIDLVRYNIPVAIGGIPLIEYPYGSGTQVAWPANPTLAPYTDIYYRGFDNAFPDTWRLEEWTREFQLFVANGNLPNLSLVRLMHDHTGNFCPKPYDSPSCPAAHLYTPELQQADNDYAVGKLVQTVAASPYAGNTLIFVLEDDAQAGPDHVDAHRSTAYIVGPYVRHHRIVSTHYDTVDMVRTIEEILGIDHLSLNDAHQPPMADVFDLNQTSWTYTAVASPLLKKTGLVPQNASYLPGPAMAPTHDQDWWAQRTKGFDWSQEDRIPADRYNRIQWEGLMGGKPYP
ncbi:MAG TPA: bifunctional YncE family protein/alkaline phosphatase family protein, partial [Acetobacteraceae bacterium]|nr:bifunctional YncE family protein/alkaline phosphatase family protein [Acetobacteraceae bacterium]